MTNFHDERKQVFSNIAFSEQRKEAVLEALQPKKRKFWLPSIVGIAVMATLLFLIVNPLTQTEVNQAFTEKSLKDSYLALYEEPQENQEILFVELGVFEDNDAIIITNYDEDNTTFVVQYAYFEDNDWKFDGMTGFSVRPEDSQQNWNMLRGQTKTIFVGVMPDDVDRVYVGLEEAPVYNVPKIPRFWLKDAQSEGTPVYYVKNNKRERVPDMYLRNLTALSVAEAGSEDYIHFFGADEMNGPLGSFMDFPLVIDSQIYMNYKPNSGDVVLVQTDGGTHLARVITRDEVELTISEGTILLNGSSFTSIPYMMAHTHGKNNIYVPGNKVYHVPAGEYFLKSDNWGSKYQVEGVYSKDEIIGKVVGYSLMDVKFNWPTEVTSLYNEYVTNKKDGTLRNATPVLVAMLQKYAKSMGDYETLYALFAESTKIYPFEDWYALNKPTDTKQTRQWGIYEAHLLQNATFNEEKNQLLAFDERTKQLQISMNMVMENGVWKTKYETIINLNH